MMKELHWIVRKNINGKKRHDLVYIKDDKKLLTGFVIRKRKGLPWIAVFVNGPQNITIKLGMNQSCRLWVQRFAEHHILNSLIAELAD